MTRTFLILTATLFTLISTSLASTDARVTTAAKEVLTRTMGSDAVSRIKLGTLPQKNGDQGWKACHQTPSASRSFTRVPFTQPPGSLGQTSPLP